MLLPAAWGKRSQPCRSAEALRCALPLVLVVAACLAPITVEAQTASRDEQRAQVAFEAGRSAYREGRYADALEDFAQAHRLSQRPELLYNIGLASDRLRLDGEAIIAFEAYLEALPNAENRGEVEARVRALRSAVALDQEAADAAAAALAQAAHRAPAEPLETPLYDEWWFWTAIGVVVAAAIAVPVGIVAGSRSESQPLIPGDVGPGGIVIALELGP